MGVLAQCVRNAHNKDSCALQIVLGANVYLAKRCMATQKNTARTTQHVIGTCTNHLMC